GVCAGKAPGGVDITATFPAINGSTHLAVSQPVPVFYTISGRVTDGTSGGILPNINIQISTGVNAGRSAKTDSTGQYVLSGITAGTMTLSASAVSYETVDRTVTLTADTRVDFVLPRVAPTPTPAPAPAPPIFGTGAFIHWDTNSSTCGCWKGTISLRINGIVAATMSCSESRTVSVAPGTYAISACDRSSCIADQTATVGQGQTQPFTLFCTSAARTAKAGRE